MAGGGDFGREGGVGELGGKLGGDLYGVRGLLLVRRGLKEGLWADLDGYGIVEHLLGVLF